MVQRRSSSFLKQSEGAFMAWLYPPWIFLAKLLPRIQDRILALAFHISGELCPFSTLPTGKSASPANGPSCHITTCFWRRMGKDLTKLGNYCKTSPSATGSARASRPYIGLGRIRQSSLAPQKLEKAAMWGNLSWALSLSQPEATDPPIWQFLALPMQGSGKQWAGQFTVPAISPPPPSSDHSCLFLLVTNLPFYVCLRPVFPCLCPIWA